jgi:hypothetical protein
MLRFVGFPGNKGARERHVAAAVTRADRRKPHGRVMSGEYLLLYTYLENRYADALVLTFAQIEDVLGFALPAEARLRREWWTDPAIGGESRYADAWILASRTAVPNLPARTVAFTRTS